MSVDHEARIGAHYQGRAHSPESRAKMSASAKTAVLTQNRKMVDLMNRRTNRMRKKP